MTKTKSKPTAKARRGFAAMSPELQRSIACKGGKCSSRAQKRDAFGQFKGGKPSKRAVAKAKR